MKATQALQANDQATDLTDLSQAQEEEQQQGKNAAVEAQKEQGSAGSVIVKSEENSANWWVGFAKGTVMRSVHLVPLPEENEQLVECLEGALSLACSRSTP